MGIILVCVAQLGALVTAPLDSVAGLLAKVPFELVPGWKEN